MRRGAPCSQAVTIPEKKALVWLDTTRTRMEIALEAIDLVENQRLYNFSAIVS